MCNLVLDFLSNYGFSQSVCSPTRGNHILDVFFTNCPSLIKKCSVLPGISDHETVFVSSDISASTHKPVARKIYLWSRADFHRINQDIEEFCIHFIREFTPSSPVNLMRNRFKNMCMTCLNSIPSKMSSTRFNQPWITNYIKRLSKRKQRSFNKARSTNLPNDWTTYYNLKKESLRACQKAYNTYVTNFPHLKDSNSRNCGPLLRANVKTSVP